MPLLQVFTSAHPADEHKRTQLLKGLSALVARVLGKPESVLQPGRPPGNELRRQQRTRLLRGAEERG
jgi:hypothetical protein